MEVYLKFHFIITIFSTLISGHPFEASNRAYTPTFETIDMPCDNSKIIKRGMEKTFITYRFNTTNFPKNYPSFEKCEIELTNNSTANYSIAIQCDDPQFYDENDGVAFYVDSDYFFGVGMISGKYKRGSSSSRRSYYLNMEPHKTLKVVFESDGKGVATGTTCGINVMPEGYTTGRNENPTESFKHADMSAEYVNETYMEVVEDRLYEVEKLPCKASVRIPRYGERFEIRSPNFSEDPLQKWHFYPNNHQCFYKFYNKFDSAARLAIECFDVTFNDKNDKLSFFVNDEYILGVTSWNDRFAARPPAFHSVLIKKAKALTYVMDFPEFSTFDMVFKSDGRGTDNGYQCFITRF